MSSQLTKQPRPLEHTAEEHLVEGENPRHMPEHHLGGTPPQPDAPERSEIEQQQDQQALDPAPVIQKAYNASGQQKELKNG